MHRFVPVFIAAAFVTASGFSTEIPHRFESTNPSRVAPVWVSTSEAVAADGRLRTEAVTPSERRALELSGEKAMQRVQAHGVATTEQCALTVATVEEGAPDMGTITSWAELVRIAESRTLYEGRVAGASAGLYAGLPFTVVQVELSRKREARVVYLLFPKGQVRVNGVTLCTSDPEFAELPEVGSRIAFFAGEAVDKSGALYRVPAERIFYERSADVVVAPRFAADPAFKEFRSLSELTRALHSSSKPGRSDGR
jgi:hypothetical protein